MGMVNPSSVFPTRVGVFPIGVFFVDQNDGLPHAGGGVSTTIDKTRKYLRSSPRGWGCFFVYEVSPVFGEVFPTRVGVFLGLDRLIIK